MSYQTEMNRQRYKRNGLFITITFVLMLGLISISGCNSSAELEHSTVPHSERWGIYSLNPTTGEVELLYTSSSKVSFLNLTNAGDTFVFAQEPNSDSSENEEICTIGLDGSSFKRLTSNNFRDVYPVWSPDDTQIAFLSLRDKDLDIYVMDRTGANERRLYDSGSHDADIHWMGNRIVFTANSQVWIMQDDGTQPTPVTHPPNAGQWGNANLPFGDYDPRLSPDGDKIIFERLVDDSSPHGNYNIYVIDSDGSGETPLTSNGYSQGIASWSHSGGKLVYIVGAIGSEGKYDIYMMNSDGTNNRNITPSYFPAAFLCHTPVFSADDSRIFFVGEWWESD